MAGSKMFVVAGRSGWAYVGVEGFSGRIYVRSALSSRVSGEKRPALKVTEMMLDGEGEFITAPLLRDLPISAIEVLLNEPTTYDTLVASLKNSDEHLRIAEAISYFRVGRRSRKSRAARPTPVLLQPKRRTIKRPSSITDEFLTQLAEFYVVAVANGDRPLVAIEREAAVPRNTAARWVQTARSRGFLATDQTVKEGRA